MFLVNTASKKNDNNFLDEELLKTMESVYVKVIICNCVLDVFISISKIPSIHPFSTAYPIRGLSHRGGWSLSQHPRAKVGDTLDMSPVYHRADI